LVFVLSINISKTIVHYWGLEKGDLIPLKLATPFSFVELNSGFNYLGYYLEPSSSKCVD